MKLLSRLLRLSLVIIIVGCSSTNNQPVTTTTMDFTDLPAIKITSKATVTHSESNPLGTKRIEMPTQTEMQSNSVYPLLATNQNPQPYPQPNTTENSQQYPHPMMTENAQPNLLPYPSPDQNGSYQAAPSNTTIPGLAQITPSPLASTPQSTLYPATLSVVDISLHATDPTTVHLASGGYQLIEFFAFWCPICKSMAPVMNYLERKYANKIRFVYLDIDDPRTSAFKQTLGYLYQPQFFLLDGSGKILKQWIGRVNQEELESDLNSIQ